MNVPERGFKLFAVLRTQSVSVGFDQACQWGLSMSQCLLSEGVYCISTSFSLSTSIPVDSPVVLACAGAYKSDEFAFIGDLAHVVILNSTVTTSQLQFAYQVRHTMIGNITFVRCCHFLPNANCRRG